jgi:hypothetical protein
MSKWMRVAALMLLPVMAACTDDSDPVDDGDPADAITMIRLTIGSQTVDITEAGANRAVDVPRGATAVAASFYNAGGGEVVLSSSSTYAIELVSQNTGRLTFTRTGAFAGTFNGLQTGAVTVAVSLLHGSHADFGPRNVTINVQAPTDG